MLNITIKQVAEMAGVSISAVSIVLNNRKGVSAETRSRIQQIIHETGYTPNVNSRRLLLQRSFNILVALDPRTSQLGDVFYATVLNHIVQRSAELGYNIVLTSNSAQYHGSALSNAIAQHNADGVIFFGDPTPDVQRNLTAGNVLYVVVDSQHTNPPYACVCSDYAKSAYAATKYLITKGHKKIGLIGMDRIPDFFLHSFTGYKSALEEAGLPAQMNWIHSSAYDEESARHCIQKIMQAPDTPTAIYCTGDILAIGAMSYLQEHGYVLPRDLSIIGIDDIALSKYYYPPLTTVRVDKKQMGDLAIDLLDELIRGVNTESIQMVSSEEIVERRSVCPIED